jgi:hypothetical protein
LKPRLQSYRRGSAFPGANVEEKLSQPQASQFRFLGKYEGNTLQQVLPEDPDYVAYLAEKAYGRLRST